jgi:hypothetical protein
MIIEARENINVKDLLVEIPESVPDLSFNPARDLTREQGNEIGKTMVGVMDNLRETEYPERVDFRFLRSVGLTAPKRIKPFMDDETWRQIRKAIVTEGDRGSIGNILEIAATAKLIAPQYSIQEPLVSPDLWYSFSSLINREMPDANLVFKDLANLRILDPDKAKDIYIDSLVIEDAKGRIDRHRQVTQWLSCGDFLANIKLSDPEKLKELGIENEIWERIFTDTKASFNDFPTEGFSKEFSIQRLARHAASLTILAAEKIEITDEGIKFIKPRQKATIKDDNKIPELRRF